MKKFVPLIAILAVVAVIVFFPTEQKRIRKVISGVEKAAMDEDVDGLMEHISFNYRDGYGGSYMVVKKKAEAAFKRYNSLEVSAHIIDIHVEEDQAEANLKVSVIASEGTNRGYIIGDAEKSREITVYLERSAYKWKVISAEGFMEPDRGVL